MKRKKIFLIPLLLLFGCSSNLKNSSWYLENSLTFINFTENEMKIGESYDSKKMNVENYAYNYTIKGDKIILTADGSKKECSFKKGINSLTLYGSECPFDIEFKKVR